MPAKYTDSHALPSIIYEISFTMSGTTGLVLQHQRILCLPDKIPLAHFFKKSLKTNEKSFLLRGRSEYDPSMKPPVRNPPGKWHLPSEVTVQTPQKVTLKLQPIPATESNTSTWPHIAPATPRNAHALSLLKIKIHLHCGEQQASNSNITKYCVSTKIFLEIFRNRWKIIRHSLFLAAAVLGEVFATFFVAAAVLGEVLVSLSWQVWFSTWWSSSVTFRGRATFGAGPLSLFGGRYSTYWSFES